MGRRQVGAFATLCMLGGSRWIVDSVLPTAMPPHEQGSLQYLAVALAAMLALFVTKPASLPSPGVLIRLAVASLLLVGLPVRLDEAASGVTQATQSALFALVPLVIVVGASSVSDGPDREGKGRTLMMPALVGFAGALLMLPFQFPGTVSGALSFAMVIAAVLSTAAGSVWMHGLLRGVSVTLALAVFCGANAIVLGMRMRTLEGAPVAPAPHDLLLQLLRCAVFDLPVLWLLLWLLQHASPSWLAARFLIIPLLTVGEAAILFHSPIDLRGISGILLVAVGSGMLLRPGTDSDESGDAIHLGLR